MLYGNVVNKCKWYKIINVKVEILNKVKFYILVVLNG